MADVNLCISLQVGCLAEDETELNPNTERVLCRHDSSAATYYHAESQLFADCRTVKLYIRSNTYDNRAPLSIPFSAFGRGMDRRAEVASRLVFVHSLTYSEHFCSFSNKHTYSECFPAEFRRKRCVNACENFKWSPR